MPEIGKDDGLREEAATWVARMAGPAAESQRGALEAWLAEHPSHRAAYNKATARFHDARMLSHSQRWARPTPYRPRLRLAFALVLAALAAATGAIMTSDRTFWPFHKASSDELVQTKIPSQVAVDNVRGPIVRHRLDDGSFATLDTQTHLRIVMSPTSRNIWMDSGRARFTVVHDGRPFVVHAGGGTVTATGTVFDVLIEPSGSIHVALIEGQVEVRSTARQVQPAAKMVAGETLRFVSQAKPLALGALDPAETRWPEGFRDFDAAPLSKIIEAANRYGRSPLRLASPDLAVLTLSGRFRIDDPARLADNIAKTLDLDVDRAGDGSLILHRR